MNNPPVVTFLAKQSASRLRAMEAEADEQIASLQQEKGLIKRALAEQVQGVGPSGATNGADNPKFESDGRSKGEKRDVFREILSTRPDHPWMPAEIRSELSMRGIESNNDAIRALLRRMGKDGELIRGEDGTGWRLASANGLHQEPLTEATG